MSEQGGNNPPIPEMLGEPATGAVFSSTDATALDVPAIAGRPAATIEGPRHANVANEDIVSYLKKQHLALQRVTWSTAHLPGTLLVSIPITPLRANQIISYLCGVHNAWNGGQDYQVKVAGTGFHAGALGIARIPPNLDPSSFKTVAQFTAFEYTVIDPKTLEAMSKHIPDQRPVMYHYMSEDFSNPNNIGGHFVIFVILQLNTSSTGTNQIDVQIFNKLSSDFRFIQVVPPNLNLSPNTDVEKWANLFNTPALHYSTIYPTAVDEIKVLAAGASSPAKVGLTNLSGVLTGIPSYVSPNQAGATGFRFYASSSTTMVPVANAGSTVLYPRNITISRSAFVGYHFPSALIDMTSPINLNANITVTGAVTGFFYFLIIPDNAVVTYPGAITVASPTGESLVTFETFANGGGSGSAFIGLTTTALSQFFASRQYQIASNEAVLCTLTSRSTGLPLTYIKIYHSGIITAPAMSETIFNFYDIQCTFVSYIQATSPFPALNSGMLQSLQYQRLEQLIRQARDANVV